MKRSMIAVTLWAAAAAALSAQPERFDDVIRNLRNPDANVRLNAVKLLREARHPEAIVPMAPLVNDPLDPIQMEAIATELSFFLVEDVPSRRRLGFLVEVRNRGGARTAFDLGPLAVWPRPAPPELVAELLKAVDDENGRVRQEAIYAAGVVARSPLQGESEQRLIKALDHYDPAVREGAARVAGRIGVKAAGDVLIKAVNDSSADVRYAAMRALGMLREERAAVALTEQLKFYGKGEGAWSALDALARIAHPSSVPLFTAHLADRDERMRRAAAEGLGRAGATASIGALETAAGNDTSNMARAAMAFALQKLGRNFVPRLVEFLDDAGTTMQAQEYLIELGQPIEKDLTPILQDPDAKIRAGVVDVLGEIGTEASLTTLQNMKDGDKDVAESVKRAIERIKIRRSS